MSADFILIIVLVVLLIFIATIVIGGFYLLNKGIKEQYRYNHTALPSLDEEKENQQEEEEQYQFESILGDNPSRKSDWSDFHDSVADEPEFEDTPSAEADMLPEVETSQNTPEQETRKSMNSLPDLS